MDETTDQAFDRIGQEGRIARTARMLDAGERLQPNQRKDIVERFVKFIEKRGITQNQAAREIGISSPTVSEVVHHIRSGKAADANLIKVNNWMELTARRDTILGNKSFVETSVAREILIVASNVAETCKMGVVFGPAQIGKTMTLRAIEGEQLYGDPLLVRVNKSLIRPLPLCRNLCAALKLPTTGTFDTLMRRLIGRLKGTKKMLMFDEADRLTYPALETVRDIHDETGCPILFSGKPKIYERLGFRDLGDFSEITDQLASRIVMKRDLTERTRDRDHPEPLFTLDDIRKLIKQCGPRLRLAPDAVKWLQDHASALGTGGVGRALVSVYLASKLADTTGASVITAELLEAVVSLTMGYEDATRMAGAVAESSGIRRIV